MHVGAYNKGKEKCCKVSFANDKSVAMFSMMTTLIIIFKTIPQLEQILSKQSTSGDKMCITTNNWHAYGK